MSIPELGKSLPGTALNGQPVQPIGLLGRDLLRHVTLIYNGSRGHFEVKIDRRTMGKSLGPGLMLPAQAS